MFVCLFSDAPLVKFCADKTFKKQFIHFFVSLFIASDRVEPVQGVSRLSPCDSQDRLQPNRNTELDKRKQIDGWLFCFSAYFTCFFLGK